MSENLWADFYGEHPTTAPAGGLPETESLPPGPFEPAFGTVTVVLDWGRHLIVRMDDGRSLEVDNDLFRRVLRGDRVAIFERLTGASLIHPRWSAWPITSLAQALTIDPESFHKALCEMFPFVALRESAVLDDEQFRSVMAHFRPLQTTASEMQKLRLRFGAPVEVQIVAVDPTDPMSLAGRIIGLDVPAIVRRDFWPFPRNLPEFDASNFIGKRLRALVIGLEERPLEAVRVNFNRWRAVSETKAMKHASSESGTFQPGAPEQFLHLALLASNSPSLETVVDCETEGGWWLRLNGERCVFLPLAEWAWSVTARHPTAGQRIRVRVWPELTESVLFASARVLDCGAMEAASMQMPSGSRWIRARQREITLAGTVFDYEQDQTVFTGTLPSVTCKAGAVSYFPKGDLAAQMDLTVMGFDLDRGHFTLDGPLEVPPEERCRIGELRPVRHLGYIAARKRLIVQWDPRYAAIEVAADCVSETAWDRVGVALVEGLTTNGLPSLSLIPNIGEWEVISCEGLEVSLRWPATGATLIAAIDSPLPLEAGQIVWIVWMDVNFGSKGTVIHGKRCAQPGRFAVGQIVSAQVIEAVAGGCFVALDGCTGFVPKSQLDTTPPKDLAPFIGNTYRFRIVKLHDERRNIILSRRECIEEERAVKRQTFLATVKIADRLKGKVLNLTDFGAFIELEGMVGLLHITDITWGHIEHPSELLQIEQELVVVVLDIDREKERVSLGLKQTQPNPWDEREKRFPIGVRVRGRVTRLVPYGAFVDIEPGVEGLVHASELSWGHRSRRPSDVLSIDQDVEAVVLGIDKKEQRILLGIRQLQPNPWAQIEGRYPIGKRVNGTVRNITGYGAFVELEEGVEGMIHVNDMSWTRKVNHPSEVLKKGESVVVVVTAIDSGASRITLGLKQLKEDPWNSIDRRFKIGTIVKARVSKIASFGAFMKLDDEIDGLVHISQVSEERVERVRDYLAVGQEVVARVIKLDNAERRIGLSIKAVLYGEKEFADEAASSETSVQAEDAAEVNPPVPSLLAPRLHVDAASVIVAAVPPTVQPGANAVMAERCLALIDSGMFNDSVEMLVDGGWLALASFAAMLQGRNPGPPRWEPLPAWGRLAALCLPAGASGLPSPVARLTQIDAILRALAGTPGEIVLHEALAESFPAGFVARQHEEFAAWLRSVAPGGATAARAAIALVRALNAERVGEPASAFRLLNDLADESSDPALTSLRSRLIRLHDETVKDPTRTVGEYRRVREEQVREGGFSHIIPVTGLDGRRLALKELRLRLLSPGELAGMSELFRREAGILSRVHHPNIVRYERQITPDSFLLEWVPGRPLEPARDGREGGVMPLGGKDGIGDPAGWWTPARVVEFGGQVAAAMSHLQEVFGRFVHNDVTPRNLLINQSAAGSGATVWVKLIDFGLSCAPEFSSISTIIDEAGVRLREAYRAPEARRGVFDDPRSDMYSLGAILFQLCARRVPASGDPLEEASWESDALAADELRRWAAPELAACVRQLLAHDLEQRPASWSDVADALRRLPLDETAAVRG